MTVNQVVQDILAQFFDSNLYARVVFLQLLKNVDDLCSFRDCELLLEIEHRLPLDSNRLLNFQPEPPRFHLLLGMAQLIIMLLLDKVHLLLLIDGFDDALVFVVLGLPNLVHGAPVADGADLVRKLAGLVWGCALEVL